RSPVDITRGRTYPSRKNATRRGATAGCDHGACDPTLHLSRGGEDPAAEAGARRSFPSSEETPEECRAPRKYRSTPPAVRRLPLSPTRSSSSGGCARPLHRALAPCDSAACPIVRERGES